MSNGTVLNVVQGFLGASIVAVAISPVANAIPQAVNRTGSVACWGAGDPSDPVNSSPNFGQSNIPDDLRGVIQVSAGRFHTAVIYSNTPNATQGTVACWGAGSSAAANPPVSPQFGQSFPPTAPGPITNATQISAGWYHTMVLRNSGATQAVTCWGAGSTAPASPPVFPNYGQSVTPSSQILGTNLTAVAAGGYHSMALRLDGQVRCWGRSDSQQTVPPAGLLATAIAAGGEHSMALRTDGTVAVWGSNALGQANVPAGLVGVSAIAAGGSHSLALRSNGTVVAWGWNAYNQSTVPSGLANVTQISAGLEHSVARRADGTVVTWGNNSQGQCQIPSSTGPVQFIAAGGFHTVALGSIETMLEAWGSNDNLQIEVPGAMGVIVDVAAGEFHTLALKQGGQVVAWGANSYGQSTIPATLGPVSAIAAGKYHSLAIRPNGTMAAWGRNDSGQCNVPAGLINVAQVSGGWSHTLVRKQDGTVAAWGSNSYGQSSVPAGLIGIERISAGGYHNLVVRSDGTVAAFGAGVQNTGVFPHFGQSSVPPSLDLVEDVAAGLLHSVALQSNGTVVAWGANSYTQSAVPPGLGSVRRIAAGDYHTVVATTAGAAISFGRQSEAQVPTPLFIPTNPAGRILAVAAGGFHSLAVVDVDNDADGVLNAQDNCPENANASQADLDGDGTGDACDDCQSFFARDTADSDGDGQTCDNCPGVANAFQTDTDADLVGDACDNCVFAANSDQGDVDSDAVGNVCDNCIEAANPSQADLDGDLLGNACDNCPVNSNADQADIDSDGVGNVCDPAEFLGWVKETTNLSGGNVRTQVFAQLSGVNGHVLGVFRPHATSAAGALSGANFRHVDGVAGGTWNPAQVTAVNIPSDSWVTIGVPTGGLNIGNTTVPDPGWGAPIVSWNQPGIPDTASAGIAGWYNSNPANSQGKVAATNLRASVANFVANAGHLPLVSMEVGFNRGIGSATLNGVGTFNIGDLTGDYDGDGLANQTDNCAAISNPGQQDCDSDGVGDACEPDINRNEIPDDCDSNPLVFRVVSGDFNTVQEAIAVAPSGSIIQISPGVRSESINYSGKNLIIEGSTSGGGITVLSNPPGNGSVVKAVSGETTAAVLRNLKIQNEQGGTAVPGLPGISGGAGIAVINSSLTIQNVIVEGCTSTQVGAGVLFFNSNSVVQGLTVKTCAATVQGGGIRVIGGAVDLVGLAVQSNTAPNGGGLSIESGDTLVQDSLISGNPATQQGGGIQFQPLVVGSKLALDGSVVRENSAGIVFGGVFVAGAGSTVDMVDSTICDNQNGNINVIPNSLGGNVICECVGDITGDAQVNAADLTVLIGLWSTTCSGCPADLNNDGVINSDDLTILLGSWGFCP